MLRAALMLQATKTCHLLAVIVCVSVGMYEFVCHASLCVCVFILVCALPDALSLALVLVPLFLTALSWLGFCFMPS